MGQHRKGSDSFLKDHQINRIAQSYVRLNAYLMLQIFPSYLHLATHKINYEVTAMALMKQEYLCDVNTTFLYLDQKETTQRGKTALGEWNLRQQK